VCSTDPASKEQHLGAAHKAKKGCTPSIAAHIDASPSGAAPKAKKGCTSSIATPTDSPAGLVTPQSPYCFGNSLSSEDEISTKLGGQTLSPSLDRLGRPDEEEDEVKKTKRTIG
jgi:hypothetical protein